ncbi:MAG: response regulator [Christensenellaceae bacterium]
MSSKKKDHSNYANRILLISVILICLSVIVLGTFTILATNKMADYTEKIYNVPYNVVRSTGMLRTNILTERNAVYNLMNGMQSTDSLLLEIKQNRQDTQKLIEHIMAKYAGSKENTAKLSKAYDEVKGYNDQVIELVLKGDEEQAKDVLLHKVLPLYEKIDAITDHIVDYSTIIMDNYVNKTKFLNNDINGNVVLFGSLMICVCIFFAVLSFYTIGRKNKEIYHREQLFHIIADNVDNVYVLYDCEAKCIEYVSENMQRVHGIPAAEYKKNPLIAKEYMDDETFLKLQTLFNVDGQDSIGYEYSLTNPITNEERYFFSKLFYVYENGKKVKNIIATSDLTKFRNTQNALKNALIAAQSANWVKRDFLSRISHEIRTPMNAIIGMIRIMEYSMDNPLKMSESLRTLKNTSVYLLGIINDILDMSKIESGKMTIEKHEFNLQEFLDGISAFLKQSVEEKKIHFEIKKIRVRHEIFISDEMRLRQILLNFLTNAVKFTGIGGSVQLYVEEKSTLENRTEMRFSVVDNGKGIASEFMNKLFVSFEQEDDSVYRNYGGTGLGLSISKSLADMLEGKISVKSTVGKGSRFTMDIWLETRQKYSRKKRKVNTLKELKVLVVDSDIQMGTHLKELVESFGADVTCVSTVGNALYELQQAGSEPFHVCMIDLFMPEMDGRNIIDIINIRYSIYIIALSASNEDQLIKKIKANAVLIKPIYKKELYTTLIDMMGANIMKSEKEEQYDFTGKRILLVDDNEVNLEIMDEISKKVHLHTKKARNGKQALDLFLKAPSGYYDAILMDVQMPVMDGYEASKAIRTSEAADAKKILIVAMTANSCTEDIAEASKNGMNEYAIKPIEPNKIYEILKKYLQEDEL